MVKFHWNVTKEEKQKKRDNFTITKLSWVGATHVQHKKTNIFNLLLSSRRKLIKLPEFASHIYWNVASPELACVQSSPPLRKNRRKGDFFPRGGSSYTQAILIRVKAARRVTI